MPVMHVNIQPLPVLVVLLSSYHGAVAYMGCTPWQITSTYLSCSVPYSRPLN
jgi:hypothetical protein